MFKFPTLPMLNFQQSNVSGSGWVKRPFIKEHLLKGIVPNSPGIYILFDGWNKPLYVGHSNVLRHRLQSYYQDDCFKEHKTKKSLRKLIKMFAYKTMPLRKAMAVEREIKHKLRYNYR